MKLRRHLDWVIDVCHRWLFVVNFSIRWVHVDCERQEGADPNSQVQDGYTCRVCKQVQEESGHNQPISSQEPSLADPEPIEGEYMSLSTPHTSDVFVSLAVGCIIEY